MTKNHKSKLLERRDRFGYFFISPYLIGLVVFIIIPLIDAIKISFSELTVGVNQYELNSVGFENYKYIFAVDPDFRQKLINSFSLMITEVPIVILFSFFIASVLSAEFKGRGIVRTILFLPVIITAGAIDNLLASDYMSDTIVTSSNSATAANSFLEILSNINIPDGVVDFIGTAVDGIYDVVVLSAVPIVIFIAALNSISESIFEAAYVEGATAWEIFWKIKFPISTPQILTCVVYCIIDSLNDASNPVISTIKSVTYSQWKYGRGAAMSFSYMILIFLVLFIVYRIIAKRVTYLE